MNEAIEMIKDIDVDQLKDYTLMRDGLIQRFEYSIDSFWKFLKMYLEEVQKVSIEPASPKAILKYWVDLSTKTALYPSPEKVTVIMI